MKENLGMRLPAVERARRYLGKCPPAISGQKGHAQTFHVACIIVHGFGLSGRDALCLIKEWNASCVPPWEESELVHKLRSAASIQQTQPSGYLLNKALGHGLASQPMITGSDSLPKPPLGPVFCQKELRRVAEFTRDVPDVYELLKLRSVVPVDDMNSATFLLRLYPNGSAENVLIFSRLKSQGQMLWKSDRSDLVLNEDFPRGPDGVWFLPQPVDGQFHPNPRLDGKLSRRSEESVTAWRFVVIENDTADPEDWLRALVQMPLRIVSICESGGRSVHALVRLDAATKADWDLSVRMVKPVLIKLGADPNALSAVRLSRLPQAKRGSRVQRLLYFNPRATGIPIIRRSNSIIASELELGATPQ